jgi:hypothetical protein
MPFFQEMNRLKLERRTITSFGRNNSPAVSVQKVQNSSYNIRKNMKQNMKARSNGLTVACFHSDLRFLIELMVNWPSTGRFAAPQDAHIR